MTKTNALRKLIQNVFGVAVDGNSVSSILDKVNNSDINPVGGGCRIIRATARLFEEPSQPMPDHNP